MLDAMAAHKSPLAAGHDHLRRRILEAHPEVRGLYGPDARTALAVPLILAVQWSAAWAVSGTNVPVVFLAAFFFGQLVIHSAAALVHETAHRLVFAERRRKLLFDLALEAILTSFGRQLTYQHEHISSHHPHLGDYERDYEHEDVCRFLARRSFRGRHPRAQRALTILELAVHLLPLGFLLAEQVFPRVYRRATGRPTRDAVREIGATRPAAAERALFIGVSAAVNVWLFVWLGPLGWLYQVWALSIFLGKCGITNLGQSLSEHPTDDPALPTRSTYWWGNRFLFNTGYHHEHHTFPAVAWSRLPRMKSIAPREFDVASNRSYLGHWWDHVRDDFGPSRRSPFLARDNADRCR
jgi:sphingolipid delta-4 desaturase